MTEPVTAVEERARIHAALGDVGRLRIVDALGVGDASPAELAHVVEMPSNLLAHHLKVLESAGLVARRRSDGDARRVYLRLRPETALEAQTTGPWERPARVLLASPHRQLRPLPARCRSVARHQHAPGRLGRDASGPEDRPWRPSGRPSAPPSARAGQHTVHLATVLRSGDLVVTVCDNAHEVLGGLDRVHWSVPDPVRAGTTAAYDATSSTTSAAGSTAWPPA